MALDSNTMAKFQDFRRAKLGAATGRIGQAMGGTAETLRTGRSAAATFADRDPDLYRQRMKKEFMAKQEAKAGIHRDLQGDEQFYFSREQEERLAVMSDIQERLRMEIQMAQRDKDRAATSAAQSAAGRRQVKLSEIQRDMGDYTNNIERMLPATAAAAEALVSSYGVDSSKGAQDGALAQAYVDQIASDEGNMEILAKMKGEDLIDVLPNGRVVATGTAQQMRARLGAAFGEDGDARRIAEADAKAQAAQAGQAALAQAGVNPQQVLEEAMNTVANSEFTDAQKYHYMLKVAGKLHIPTGMLEQMVPGFKAIEGGYASERQVGQELIDLGFQQAEEIAGQTYAGDADRPSGLADLQSAWDQATKIAADSSAERRGEAPQEGMEGVDPDAEYSEMMGVPGLKRGATAKDRMIQTLDLIEQYPDKPVMQTLRDQIMASPEFGQFKEKMGYGDDMFAFREMNRMSRKQKKSTLKNDRQRRAGRMQQEMTARKPPTLPGTPGNQTPIPKPKAPESVELVEGSDSRVAGE